MTDTLGAEELLSGFTVRGRKAPSTFWPNTLGLKRGLYGQHGKLARCGELLAKGHSIAAASHESGICPFTARMLFWLLERDGVEMCCPCGVKTAGHPAWCDWRRRQSAARTAYERRVWERYGAKMEICRRLMEQGSSVRAAARASGVSRWAATRVLRQMGSLVADESARLSAV